MDTSGATHVVGEVVNNTRLPVRQVRVSITFFDGSAEPIATGSAYTLQEILDPGEKSGFHAIEAAAADRYTLRVSYSTATRAANHNFAIEAASQTIDDVGYTHIFGTATNLNSAAAEFVTIHATFYDSAGRVVGVEFTDVIIDEASVLEPRETAPFELLFQDISFTTYALVGESSDTPSLPVTLAASPTTPVYGTQVRISGSAGADAQVTIQRWDLTAGWVVLTRTTADATGSYAVDAKITTTWFVRAVTEASPSVPRTYLQKALISLKSNLTTMRKGAAVTLSGIVRPLYPGKKVAIQQYRSGAWKTIAYATLNSASAFSYRWVSKAIGTFVFRALVGAMADSTSNVSSSRRITVR